MNECVMRLSFGFLHTVRTNPATVLLPHTALSGNIPYDPANIIQHTTAKFIIAGVISLRDEQMCFHFRASILH